MASLKRTGTRADHTRTKSCRLRKNGSSEKDNKTHHDNLAQIIHKSRLWIKPSIVL